MSSSARAVESDPALGKSPRIKGCLPGWEHSGAARWPFKKKKKRKKTTQGICFSAENSLLSAQIVVFYKPRVPFSESSWVSTERVDDLVSASRWTMRKWQLVFFTVTVFFFCWFLGLFPYLELKELPKRNQQYFETNWIWTGQEVAQRQQWPWHSHKLKTRELS